jgi:hypothetical protein
LYEYATLNQIKQHRPCKEGWEKLLKYLGKTDADDEVLPILTILESNGLDDALWALRAVEGKEREIRLMAADFADQAARDYANGLISLEEMAAARAAARAAAEDAAWVAARGARAAWAAAAFAAFAAARGAKAAEKQNR